MKLLLVCNAGMSTGIMQVKLTQSANARGMATEVLAVPLVELDDHIDTATAILLGPQIRFALNDVQKKAPEGVPVLVISPPDFGTMNAEKVLDDVMAAVAK